MQIIINFQNKPATDNVFVVRAVCQREISEKESCGEAVTLDLPCENCVIDISEKYVGPETPRNPAWFANFGKINEH